MMELMEPSTYLLHPRSAELKSPENWKDGFGIKDFLSATQNQSLEELKEVSFSTLEVKKVQLTKKHDFLPKESLAKCLRAHIFCALRAAGTYWDIISLP
jgi:hypothetical protein